MFRTIRIAAVTSFGLAVLSSMPVKADVLATIESECATLGATQYQIAFVTAHGTTATSADIQDYNDFVNGEAALGSSYLGHFVPAGTTWRAIASTISVSALDNAPTYPTVPIFDTQGHIIVTGSGQLWNTQVLSHPISYDETGASLETVVWSGSLPDGTADYHHELGRLDDGITLGYSTATTPDRWFWGAGQRWNTSSTRLYALSSPITVPEPSIVALLGSALLGVLGLSTCRVVSVHAHDVTGGAK